MHVHGDWVILTRAFVYILSLSKNELFPNALFSQQKNNKPSECYECENVLKTATAVTTGISYSPAAHWGRQLPMEWAYC